MIAGSPLVGQKSARRIAIAAFICLLPVATCLYVLPALRLYLNFQLQNFDYGIQFSSLDHLARFQTPYLSARGLLTWADNQDYIQLLLAPTAWLPFPHEAIIVVHSLGILLPGILCFFWLLPTQPLLAVMVAVAAWLSPFALNMNMDLFHPEAMATAALLSVYMCAAAGRRLRFCLSLLWALSCKEDVAITVGALAFVMAIFAKERRIPRLWLVAAIALASLTLLVNQRLVLPYAKDMTSLWLCQEHLTEQAAFGHTSPWFSSLGSRLTSWSYVRGLLNEKNLTYLLMIAWPLLLLPLRAALPWLIALSPAVMVNIIGGSYLVLGAYHYDHSTFAVVLIMICSTLKDAPLKWARGLAILCVMAFLHTNYGFHPTRTQVTRMLRADFWHLSKSPVVENLERLSDALPRSTSISADYTTINYLFTGRHDVFMYPNPFEPSYFGIYGSCDGRAMPFHGISDVDLVLLRPGQSLKQENREALPDLYAPATSSLKQFGFQAYVHRDAVDRESILRALEAQ